MKITGILLSILVLSSLAIAFEFPSKSDYTQEQQFCIDNGHTLKSYTYSFGTYWYCYDKYGNECGLQQYYEGTCNLVENTKKNKRLFRKLQKFEDLKEINPEKFEKKITKCRKDSDCRKVQSTKCSCSRNFGGISMHKEFFIVWLSIIVIIQNLYAKTKDVY